MVDLRKHYFGWVANCAAFYAKDLAALTQEQYEKTYGGATRSPRNISAEVAFLTQRTIDLVKGGEMLGRDDEGMKAMEEALSTPALAGEAVVQAATDLGKAVLAASDEALAREIMMPWGQPMSVYALVHLTATHIMYHDGQLNYVQAINGDAEMHWF